MYFSGKSIKIQRWREAKEMLAQSHQEIMQLAERFTNEELFQKVSLTGGAIVRLDPIL